MGVAAFQENFIYKTSTAQRLTHRRYSPPPFLSKPPPLPRDSLPQHLLVSFIAQPFTHPLMQQYLLNTYYVPGKVRGAG